MFKPTFNGATIRFNPWRGCTKVSPGCANCYAEVQSRRNPAVLGEWGQGGKRVIAAESYWKQPLKWDRAAAKAGERRRVFCASLADVFDSRPELDTPRSRLLDLIEATPHLDWLLLTKRPENWRPLMAVLSAVWACDGDRLGAHWLHGTPPKNVWLGVSAEDQQRADERVPDLLKIPAAVRFVSAEPLLEPLNLSPWLSDRRFYGFLDEIFGRVTGKAVGPTPAPPGLDWVIVGGESGPRARPCNLAWIRSIRDQCEDVGVACFVKQLGSRSYDSAHGPEHHCNLNRLRLTDPKGGDPAEWPEDLRVRQFPKPEAHDG